MTIRNKLIIAGVALLAAVVYLASAGVQGGWVYYMGVDEYLADTSMQQRRVRLNGTVATEEFTSGAGLAQFNLLGTTGRIAVAYDGVVPDMFKPGGEVVVEGRFDPAEERFVADLLMTKCASKYETDAVGEAAPPGHPPVTSHEPI